MTEESAGTATDAPDELLSWPPPGLARIQGDLWIVVRKMGAAGFVLVLPLLFALSLPKAGEGLGPFGDAWWIIIVTTLVGFGLFVDALVMCVRLLIRARVAIERGYSTRVIGLTATDQERTAGFLLQGAHAFSTMPAEVRVILTRIRILAGLLHLAAASWLTIGFGLCLLLAARGALSPAGLAAWTLAPVGLFWAGGIVLRGIDSSLSRRARKEWHQHPWAEDLVREEVADWKAAAVGRGLTLRVPALRRSWLTAIVVALIAAAVVGSVPTVSLIPASSMGAILTSLTGWSFERSMHRAAVTEAYRGYRLEPDPSVGAVEAGELLRVLTTVSASPSEQGIREAPRRYEERWFPESAPEGWEGHMPPLWSDSIWLHLDRGISPELRAYLERVASHPAHEDFSRLARAAELDLIDAFYERPFDPSGALYELPIPRFSGIRSGANAHIAAAALMSLDGRHEDARRTVSEVISVGFLLQDEAPFLIGSFVGTTLAGVGADALYHAARRSGDDVSAASLLAAREGTDRASAMLRSSRVRGVGGQEAYLERARSLAADPQALRGLRWEMAHMTAVVAPCLNVRSIVFGPGEEYDAWLEEVRTSLVRTEAEAEYFEVAARGLELEGGDAGPVARLLAAAMGGGEAPSTCAHVIGTLRSMM